MLYKLPPELLLKVFDHVYSLKDLSQCRLVCKALNCPAEIALFSNKRILLSSPENAKAFYYHLERNQTVGKYIKYLRIDNAINSMDALHRILTPCARLEKLRINAFGVWHESTFYESDFFDDWMVAQHLEQVHTLNKVDIKGTIQVDAVKYILRKYPNIQEVNVFLDGDALYEEYIEHTWDRFDLSREVTILDIHLIIEELKSVPICRFYHWDTILPFVKEEIRQHAVDQAKKVSFGKKGYWSEITINQ